MKRATFTPLHWAALAALALPAGSTLAQSAVTIAGVADSAARSVSNQGLGAIKSLVSGSNQTSRLTIRGSEDLGGGLRASFWLEHGIAFDTGNPTGGFWDRRSTVSLTGSGWGELRLGRDFVPSYVGWSRFDVFGYVGVAGSNNLVSATPLGPIRSTWGTAAVTTVRASNAVQYLQCFLPAGLGGFEGHAMVAAAEGGTADNIKTIGGRVGWAGGAFAVSLAHTVSENANTSSSKFKDTAIGGTTNSGTARVNLAWRKFEQGSAEQTNLMASGVLNLGSGELKLSAIKANMAGRVGTTSGDANDALQLGLGYVYNLSKRSALYATHARIDNDGAAPFVVPGGKLSSGYEFGVRHNF